MWNNTTNRLIEKKRVTFFGASIDAITLEMTVAAVLSAIEQRRMIKHSVVNVAKLVNMQADGGLRDSVNGCNIINADGIGVVWGARFLGIRIPERVAGIDLMLRLCSLGAQRGFQPFLLGATREVVEKAANRLCETTPGLELAGYRDGYFWGEEESVIKEIKNSKADMLFVAISSPKKEYLIDKYAHQLEVPFIMGVGGSFDVIAGKVKRAPMWMQKVGLEWCFRLTQEPRRMWRRYLLSNLRFVWMLSKAKWKSTLNMKWQEQDSEHSESNRG